MWVKVANPESYVFCACILMFIWLLCPSNSFREIFDVFITGHTSRHIGCLPLTIFAAPVKFLHLHLHFKLE